MAAAVAAAAATAAPLPPLEEMWLPRGRGQDWSLAGYREGRQPLPSSWPVSWDVKRAFGAKGDGKADDSKALQRAVDAANASPTGGVVWFPQGTYVLRVPLTITRSRVVLRGAGPAKTTILIPRSLSDVFNGTWLISKSGKVKSAWNAGGGFITFLGNRQRSINTDTLLARITGKLYRGWTELPVDDASKFRVGMRVRIFLNDASTEKRRRMLAAAGSAAAAAAAESGSRSARLLVSSAPAWVQRHPVFQSAVEDAARFGEYGDLAPAQAAAAEQAYWQAAGGTVGLAADKGTLTAWLYGNNLAVSGGDTGTVDTDEVSFTAFIKHVDVKKKRVTIHRGLPFPVLPPWQATIHRDAPTLQDSGIEHMSIFFRHTKTQPHHASRGMNALELKNAVNLWVRNVHIINADNGIFTAWLDRSTLTDVVLNVSVSRMDPRWPDALNGHHALSLGEGHGNMLSRTAPWSNLITNCALGEGSRAFKSGGQQGRGAHSGVLNTYWNLRRSSGQPVPLPDCSFGPSLNFVGSFTGGSMCRNMNWRVLPLKRGAPFNLYNAQRRERDRRVQLALARKPAPKPRGRPRQG